MISGQCADKLDGGGGSEADSATRGKAVIRRAGLLRWRGGHECAPGGSFLVGAVAQKLFGTLI